MRLASDRLLLHWNEKLYETALLLFDAIGLGIFTVIGVQTAYIARGELNAFLAIFVGVVTGCGGGVLRDVFINEEPLIFRKEIYALACVLGGIAYFICARCGLSTVPSGIICGIVVFLMRILAVKYRLHLPTLKGEE